MENQELRPVMWLSVTGTNREKIRHANFANTLAAPGEEKRAEAPMVKI